jgi:hypothetical protein
MNITQRAASLLALAGYHLSRYKLLFVRLDELTLGLLLFVPVYYLGWQSWRTGLPLWDLLLSLVCLLLLVVFWAVRRQKYTLFRAVSADEIESKPLKAEERIRVRGTGFFEVSGMQRYFVAAPAVFWRTELADYILMAKIGVAEIPLLIAPTEERGMWYIFINSKEIAKVTPGVLFVGFASLPTLQVAYRIPNGRNPMYLSFERKHDLNCVLHELSK